MWLAQGSRGRAGTGRRPSQQWSRCERNHVSTLVCVGPAPPGCCAPSSFWGIPGELGEGPGVSAEASGPLAEDEQVAACPGAEVWLQGCSMSSVRCAVSPAYSS